MSVYKENIVESIQEIGSAPSIGEKRQLLEQVLKVLNDDSGDMSSLEVQLATVIYRSLVIFLHRECR